MDNRPQRERHDSEDSAIRTTVCRILSACAGAICLAAAWEIVQLGNGPFHSGLSFLAFLGAVLGFLALLVMTLAPSGWWAALRRLAQHARRRIISTDLPRWPVEGTALALVGFVSYVLLTSHLVPRQVNVLGNDQSAYLNLANDIHRFGGPAELVRRLYGGQFAEANRHPFYPALLSWCPTFEAGKLLSAAIGGLTMGVLVALAARRFGWLAAGVFGVLLATNMAFCRACTLVTCEALLVFWSGVAWFLLTRPRGRRGRRQSESSEPGDQALKDVLGSCSAGAAVGLAYLTKGTGLFLLLGVLVWLAIRLRIERRQIGHTLLRMILIVLAFVVVSSPLLARNIRRYGNPLYNVNSYLLFADRYEDPQQLAENQSVVEAAAQYFRGHSFGQLLAREVKGLAWEVFIVCRLLGPAPLDDSRVLAGIALLLLCLVGAVAEPGRDFLLALIWLAIFVSFFAWYLPVAAGERFLLPLLVPLLSFAACGLARVGWLCGRTGGGRPSRLVCLFGGLSWCCVWVAATRWLAET